MGRTVFEGWVVEEDASKNTYVPEFTATGAYVSNEAGVFKTRTGRVALDADRVLKNPVKQLPFTAFYVVEHTSHKEIKPSAASGQVELAIPSLSKSQGDLAAKAARLVYSAHFADEDGEGLVEVPVPDATIDEAVSLLTLLADWAVRRNLEWAWPRVDALSDGRLTLEWISEHKRVLVYLPSVKGDSEDNYTFVVKERGHKADRVVAPAMTVMHRLIGFLCHGKAA